MNCYVGVCIIHHRRLERLEYVPRTYDIHTNSTINSLGFCLTGILFCALFPILLILKIFVMPFITCLTKCSHLMMVLTFALLIDGMGCKISDEQISWRKLEAKFSQEIKTNLMDVHC